LVSKLKYSQLESRWKIVVPEKNKAKEVGV
jgi:hypothetical protein